MCNPASFVATKTHSLWSPTPDSHERIIEEHNLHAGVYPHVNFVRIEIAPKNGDLSTDSKAWRYKVDQDIVPDWYNARDCERRCRTELVKWKRAKLITAGHQEIDKGLLYAYGSATVKAYNFATVIAFNSAKVAAYCSTTVKAYGSVIVHACDSASVEAFDSAEVTVYDNAIVKKGAR